MLAAPAVLALTLVLMTLLALLSTKRSFWRPSFSCARDSAARVFICHLRTHFQPFLSSRNSSGTNRSIAAATLGFSYGFAASLNLLNCRYGSYRQRSATQASGMVAEDSRLLAVAASVIWRSMRIVVRSSLSLREHNAMFGALGAEVVHYDELLLATITHMTVGFHG